MRFKSESDKWQAINALQLAADRYDENARIFREPAEARWLPLAQQFEDQAKATRRIALQIENEG